MTDGPRSAAFAAPLPDGALIAGGYDGVNGLASAETYNPSTGNWSPAGSMAVSRSLAVAAPLLDGRVLIAGGWDGTNNLQSAEIFDPATRSFSATGSMTVPRTAAVAAPLPDGRVLVAGGDYEDGGNAVNLDSAEVFDPATGSFSPTAWRMNVPRTGAVAAPLADGRVLVAGGDPDNRKSAEIFDPATGSFSFTGSMINGSASVAAPLPDGRVLLAGSGGLNPSGEIFDLATGSFSADVPPTVEGRAGGAAASLPDGRVLLAGGFFFTGVHTPPLIRQSAELFTPSLTRKLTRAKVIVYASAAGTVTAVETGVDKRHRLLKRTSTSGGPGRIKLKLRPTARGERRLKRKHRLQLEAMISFSPARVRGRCVTLTGPCYGRGYAIHETDTLTLKTKKRK